MQGTVVSRKLRAKYFLNILPQNKASSWIWSFSLCKKDNSGSQTYTTGYKTVLQKGLENGLQNLVYWIILLAIYNNNTEKPSIQHSISWECYNMLL